MSVKLLTEHHLECLSLKGGCTGLSESTLVKKLYCRKSHVTAHLQRYLPKGQSSPGNLHSGQQASNGILQIPQLSSFATHLHVATAVQLKKYIYMLGNFARFFIIC